MYNVNIWIWKDVLLKPLLYFNIVTVTSPGEIKETIAVSMISQELLQGMLSKLAQTSI